MADAAGRPKAPVKPEPRVSGQFEEGRIGRDGLRATSSIVKTYQDEAVAAAPGRPEEKWS